MPSTTKHTRDLDARQRARLATERDRERVKRREDKLVAAFRELDKRTEAEIKVGEAIIELKELGGTNATIADELGLTPRDVGALISLAEDSGEHRTGTDATTNGDQDVERSVTEDNGGVASSSASYAG